MSIKKEILNLKETDVWSLLLFVLFKMKDSDDFSCISELAYVLDKRNLLKLCEYFGGCTITIPTVDELEQLIYGMLLYQKVDIEKMEYDVAVQSLHHAHIDNIKVAYRQIKEVLDTYEIESRVGND